MSSKSANDADIVPLFTVSDEIEIKFPKTEKSYTQDQEYCVITMDGVEKRIRFHDYDEVFSIPGLYEKIFYEHLGCCSPKVVCKRLIHEIEKQNTPPSELSVFEIGAGNGMVGEELNDLGVDKIVGVDILIEAKLAAYRDRPAVYDKYYALDLTDMPEDIEEAILRQRLNSLVSVAALGFGDLPPLAFAKAFNLIEENGWIAFNIKDQFLGPDDNSGFSNLIRRMMDEGILTITAQEKYQHRLSIEHKPLYYYAVIGQKNKDLPRTWYETLH